jgi:hypothetical protein
MQLHTGQQSGVVAWSVVGNLARLVRLCLDDSTHDSFQV